MVLTFATSGSKSGRSFPGPPSFSVSGGLNFCSPPRLLQVQKRPLFPLQGPLPEKSSPAPSENLVQSLSFGPYCPAPSRLTPSARPLSGDPVPIPLGAGARRTARLQHRKIVHLNSLEPSQVYESRKGGKPYNSPCPARSPAQVGSHYILADKIKRIHTTRGMIAFQGLPSSGLGVLKEFA